MLEGVPYHPRGKNKKEGVPALDTELLKDIPHEPRERQEKPEFHFEEIANIEKGVTSLAEQLKAKIEAGEYDVLMSDEAGGRIPTLIFRKIFKAVAPEHEFKTLFVNGGGSIPQPELSERQSENYEQFLQYIKEKTKDAKKVLLLTQYVHNGLTTARFAYALSKIGVDFDIAAVHASIYEPYEDFSSLVDQGKVFIGSKGGEHSALHERHERLSGVTKKDAYNPYPAALRDVIETDGRGDLLSNEDWNESFKLSDYDTWEERDAKFNDPKNQAMWEEKEHAPLTEEEKNEIQETINLSREDVDTMAQKVVKKVWHKDSGTMGQ